MDRQSIRTAEITALRRRVAGGSRDIERVYFPLAHCLNEAGERDEAIAVYRAAMQCGMEDGFFFKAIVCLHAAQALAPGDPVLAKDESRLRAAIDPDLWACAARPPPLEAVVACGEERYYEQLKRCTISWVARDGVADVTIDHSNEMVPTGWIEGAQYGLIVDGCADPILCRAVVTDAQRTSHRLTLTPASPTAEAAIRWHVRVRAETGQSNIAALYFSADTWTSHRIRNVYYDAPATASN